MTVEPCIGDEEGLDEVHVDAEAVGNGGDRYSCGVQVADR